MADIDPEAPTSDGKPRPNNIAGQELSQFIDRIERLETEIQGLKGDKSDIYGEAKGCGYDTRTIRKIVALRKKDADERREEEDLLDAYLHAIGMI
jgi:uncharacterized protein (UPF0335 family)